MNFEFSAKSNAIEGGIFNILNESFINNKTNVIFFTIKIKKLKNYQKEINKKFNLFVPLSTIPN